VGVREHVAVLREHEAGALAAAVLDADHRRGGARDEVLELLGELLEETHLGKVRPGRGSSSGAPRRRGAAVG
jgi:hypothetical protein